MDHWISWINSLLWSSTSPNTAIRACGITADVPPLHAALCPAMHPHMFGFTCFFVGRDIISFCFSFILSERLGGSPFASTWEPLSPSTAGRGGGGGGSGGRGGEGGGGGGGGGVRFPLARVNTTAPKLLLLLTVFTSGPVLTYLNRCLEEGCTRLATVSEREGIDRLDFAIFSSVVFWGLIIGAINWVMLLMHRLLAMSLLLLLLLFPPLLLLLQKGHVSCIFSFQNANGVPLCKLCPSLAEHRVAPGLRGPGGRTSSL